MKKLSLSEPMVQKCEVLSRAQLKKVLGGDGSTPSGCIVYSIEEVNGNVERRFKDEYGETDSQAAQAAADNYATTTGGRYGYDCPDENGAYEHDYIWS